MGMMMTDNWITQCCNCRLLFTPPLSPFYPPSFHLARSRINGWGDDDNDDDSGGGTGALVVRPARFFKSRFKKLFGILGWYIFLMSVTCSCLNVVFTIGWRVGCKFRNRWCCSYWGRPLDANSYWGGGSWCSWSDVLPMLLLAWILWLAPLCLIIIICNHKYTYNTEIITSAVIVYTFWKSYQHIAKCLSIFFAKYLPYSAYMHIYAEMIWI